ACDIVWLAEPLQGSHAADLLDLLFGLAIEKELGSDRSRGDGVDGDLVSAKLVGEDVNEALDACLGGDVRTVGGEVFSKDAAGEGDDTATLRDVLRCLREDEEGSAQVRGDDFIECFYVAFGDGREGHDACVVDDNIDLPEGLEGLLEEPFDVFKLGNVGL